MWFKRTEIIFLTVLEARVGKQGVSKATLPLGALGENPSFSLSVSGGCQHSLVDGHIAPISASVDTLPSPLCGSDFPVSLVRVYVMAFRAHQIIQDDFSISKSLVTSAKSLP